MTKDFNNAFEATDFELATLADLARAALDLGTEHPALGSSDPAASSILSLIRVISVKAEAAIELHQVEWNAARPRPEAGKQS